MQPALDGAERAADGECYIVDGEVAEVVQEDDLALRVAEDRPSGDAAPSPEAAALATEQRRLLLDAMGRLGENDRQVIACRYFLELSEAEMAAALGCRPGTVKSRLSRALDRLRTLCWRCPG